MTRLRNIVACFVAVCAALGSKALYGASIRPSILTGLMQQPSSQYYHYVYGGQFDLARKEDAAFMRVQYLERPAFHHAGYVDQDFSGALMFGARVLKHGNLGISAVIGGGYAWGYLKEDAAENPQREAYRLPGVATGIEGRWSIKHVDVRISHQLMICQNDRAQLAAYVAWPFTWFLLAVSTPVTWGER